jgi:hypothetical protein|tara:strand:+ start:579 stop:1139 length:561 start_codon:yes stop_codon:yes gene_type:complete
MSGGWVYRGAIKPNAVVSDSINALAVTTAKLAADSVTMAKLDEAVLQKASVQITTGQILALNAAPKTLVAAPGAGKAIMVRGVFCALDYNSAAYAGIAGGEDWVLKYTNGSGDEITGHIETTGWLDQTSDQLRWVGPIGASNAVADVIPVVNAAVVMHQLSGEITTGNSPVNVDVYYHVMSVPTGS